MEGGGWPAAIRFGCVCGQHNSILDAVLSLTSSVIETVAEGEMVDRCCFTLLTEADTQAEIQATLVSNGPGKCS